MTRSLSAVPRGPVTDRLITELETEGFPVGDNDTPTDPYGWQGEPNGPTSTFIPWMGITEGLASQNTPPGAFGDTGTMWRMPYSIFYAGLSRKQCDALADKMRLALCNIARETLTTTSYGDWRIMKVSCTALGTSNRIGSAFPDHFTQTDNFEVWITKEG